MGWVTRKGRRYYYRSHWVNGRNQKEYVGTGKVAEMAARLDAEAKERRELVRAVRRRTLDELNELDALFDQLDRAVSDYVSAVMTAAGFHRHRGEWRKKTVDTKAPQPASAPNAPAPEAPNPALALHLLSRDELIERARHGDQTALDVMRQRFDNSNLIEEFVGDISKRALASVVIVATGKDLVLREAMKLRLLQLRDELAGSDPSPLELMLVDRVVSMWFQLHQLERATAFEGDDDIVRAGYHQRALTAAQARYFAAIRELGRLRRKEPPRAVQVNIANEQVNVVNAPKG